VEVDVVSLAAEFPNDNPELHRGVSWVCLHVTGAPVAILPEPEPVIAAPEPEPEAVVVELKAIVVEPELVFEVEAAPPVEVVEVVEPEPIVPEARISGIVPRGEIRDDEGEDDDEIVVEELPPLDEAVCVEGAPDVAQPAVAAIAVIETPVELPAEVPVETSTALPPAPDDPFVTLVSTLADVAIGAGSPYVASLLPALLLEGRLEQTMPADAAQALAEVNIVRDNAVTEAFIGQTRAWRALLAGTSDDFAACGNAMLDEWAAELLARLLGAPSRATTLRRDVRAHGVAAFGLVEAA
jgi:hypothetical protein